MKNAILIFVLAALTGCAGYDATSANEGGRPIGGFGESSRTATDFLYEHDPASARAEYAADGNAAGVAITSIMLLPYSDASTRLITNHLGGLDALDAQGDVIWGDQGLAYFISRGVAWDDSPSTAGLKTLLVDRLPWSRVALHRHGGAARSAYSGSADSAPVCVLERSGTDPADS